MAAGLLESDQVPPDCPRLTFGCPPLIPSSIQVSNDADDEESDSSTSREEYIPPTDETKAQQLNSA